MPHFFFDILEGEATSRDDVGLDLPDLASAKTEAVASLPDIMRESRHGRVEGWTVGSRVRSESGRVVFQATLSLRAEDFA